MLGCIDEEVEAAVVGAAECDDVQQPHRSEAGQQTKCQNDHAQDQTPLPAPTAPLCLMSKAVLLVPKCTV